jgi:hypothetical protein
MKQMTEFERAQALVGELLQEGWDADDIWDMTTSLQECILPGIDPSLDERYDGEWCFGVMYNPKEVSTCREICTLRGLCKIQFKRAKKKSQNKKKEFHDPPNDNPQS